MCVQEVVSIENEKGREEYSLLCKGMGYTVDGIPQARILEWVAYPFSCRSS